MKDELAVLSWKIQEWAPGEAVFMTVVATYPCLLEQYPRGFPAGATLLSGADAAAYLAQALEVKSVHRVEIRRRDSAMVLNN